MSPTPPLLSIVIPVYNKWAFTKACLNDLFQLSSATHEIIVVDNGSTDDTQTKLLKFVERPGFIYLRQPENKGFASAVNVGYRASTSPNVLFLNNDIRVKASHQNWTQNVLDTIATHSNALVGPTAGFVNPLKSFQFEYETSDIHKPINYMSGWCLAASKLTWQQLDLNGQGQIFDESFFAYFEDTDLGFRAKTQNIGFKLIDLPVVHFGKITSAQVNTRKLYMHSKELFLKKWKHSHVLASQSS